MSKLLSLVFYIIIFCIVSCFFKNKKNKFYKEFALIGVLLLFLLFGVREGVGTDYYTYMNQLERIGLTPWESILTFSNFSEEMGFSVLMKLTFGIGGKFLFLGTTAVIPVIIVYITLIRNYYTNISLVMLIFLFLYFPFSLNVIRQYIAIGIVFYGLRYVFENKIIYFLTCILFAALFHRSALIAFPIYFLWNINTKSLIKGMKLTIFFLIFTISVFNYEMIFGYISTFTGFERLELYSNVSKVGENRDFIIRIFLAGIILLFKKQLIKHDKRNELFIAMYMLSLVIGLTGFFHPQIKRLALYYELPVILILGCLPQFFVKKQQIIIKILVAVYCIIYFIIVFYLLGQAHIIPYDTYI